MKGLLCFMRERATTPCNCSGSLCLFICYALASVPRSSPGKQAPPAPAGGAFAGERGQTLSPHGLRFPENETALKSRRASQAHCSGCHGWGMGPRRAYQIFICLMCRVQILWTGKTHYVWISVGAASLKICSPRIRGQIDFVYR